MKRMFSPIQLLLVVVVILLASCGGGSGKSTSAQSSTSQITSSSSSLSRGVKVSISVIGNGKLGVAETLLSKPGQQLEVPIEPDDGFFIASVSGCPGSYTLYGYITDKLTKDCILQVKFDEDIVEPISDPGLKKLVKKGLGLSDADVLTARKMWPLESVYPGVIDKTKIIIGMRGIEYAKNLTSLTIINYMEDETPNTNILDVSPLLELTNLTSLNIGNIRINDLSHISKLKKLRNLQIIISDLNDISFLASLKELRTLDLSSNDIRHISVLKDLHDISYLSLDGNKIDSTELEVLKGKRIRELYLRFNPIESLDFLRGNSALSRLNIDGTLVNSLDPLLDTGLGQDSYLYVNSTCLSYTNNKHLIETRQALLARGVEIYETPVDFAYEYERNSYMVADECPARNVQISTNINASYEANGTLSVDWSISGNLNESTLYCAVYAGMELQQLREPLINIENCPLVGNKIIDGFPFTNEDLNFILSDGYGIHKNILVKPVGASSLGPVIQSIDWGQTVISANPKLVQNRDALLRVHVVSSAPSPVPDVEVQLLLDGQSKTIGMEKPAQLPDAKRYQSLSDSYLLTIPKEWIKPGLNLKVTLKGQKPRMLQPVVDKKTDLYLTVVPIDILGEVAELPAEADIQSTLKNFWPLSDVITRIHPVFKSKVITGGGMWNLWNELEELRVLENSTSYYYGFFSNNLYKTLEVPFSGLGMIGGYSAIGDDSTNKSGYAPDWAFTMLHEIGHNFSLNHISCGNPSSYDNFYPYPVGTIGSLGISADLQNLYQPERHDADGYADIMGYCWPKHVSDYSFMKVQDYLELHLPKTSSGNTGLSVKTKSTGAVESKSLYISGEISSSGIVTLRRIIPVQQPLVEQLVGDYKIVLVSRDGEQIEQAFGVNVLDHATKDSPQFFSVKIPLVDIASVEIFFKGSSVFKQQNQLASGIVRKSSSLATLEPKLRETGSSICATWSTQQYKSASLLLQHGEAASVVFIDDESGDVCASTGGLSVRGEWQLSLRNGLQVEQVIFDR